jgi:hypothetical protein
MTEPKTVVLKLAAEFRQGDQPPSQVTVSVDGQGELAERVALAVSETFQHMLRDSAVPQTRVAPRVAPAVAPERSASSGEPSQDTASPVQPVQPLDWTPAERAEKPAAEPVAAAASHSPVAAMPVNTARAEFSQHDVPWFKRHRVRITAWTGLVLLALAVLIPMLAPPELRREVWPMPVAFGLAGALSLMSALMPERGSVVADARVSAQPSVARAKSTPSPQDAQRIARLMRPGLAQRTGGLMFGLVLALGGLLAPFLLPGGPDERFLMMLGFAPVAAIGLLLLWVFARRAMRPRLQVVGGAEAALTRNRSGFQAYAPTVIVGLVLLLGSVLIVVIVGTMLPLLTR